VSSIAGRSILVTGASGSLGVALVRRLGREAPFEIRALQRKAAGAERLRDAVGPSVPLRLVKADVTDGDAVADAMKGIDVVFHLAAEKDVVTCEEHPALAVRTNVIGSDTVVQAAARLGAHVTIVAASSDKASLATSVLGLTKALMERIFCAAGGSSVRLGGVLGSSGSVLELWRRSAQERGVIEVTDPESTRFVLTEDEAVSALLRASERGRSGEILIPTMRAYRLGDLAAVFARANDIEIRVVGLRRGEGRHTDALSTLESAHAHQDGDWRVLVPGRQFGGVAPYRSDDAERLTREELEQVVGTVAST